MLVICEQSLQACYIHSHKEHLHKSKVLFKNIDGFYKRVCQYVSLNALGLFSDPYSKIVDLEPNLHKTFKFKNAILEIAFWA